MPQIVDRSRRATGQAGVEPSRALPVLLATLSVRVDPSAERMAIDSALEAGVKLIVANMLVLPPYPLTFMLAPEYATLPHEEDLDAVRATAARGGARDPHRAPAGLDSQTPHGPARTISRARGRAARVRPAPLTDAATPFSRRRPPLAPGR